MKNVRYSIAVALLLFTFGFNSCHMLDEETYGSPTTDEMMANPDNVVLLAGQAYADVKWLHDHWGYWGVNLLTSDEGVCPVRVPGGHWNDGGYWKNLNTHNWNEFGDAFKNIWNTTISGAVLCNKLLYTLDLNKEAMSGEDYDQFTAELRALRSYYYYMLFDCFGRIPYKEDFASKTEPLMNPALVWTKLVICLEQCAKDLPYVTDEASRASYYGRCTQGMAYALLARLYLNAPSYVSYQADRQGETFLEQLQNDTTASRLLKEANIKITSEQDFYTNCCRCCEAVITSGSYQIEEDYFTNFLIDNSVSKENIFVIVENGDANFDYRDYAGNMANKLRITMLTLHYCHQTTWNLIEKPWNGFCARPQYINRFKANPDDDNFNADVRGPGNEGNGTNNKNHWGWFIGPIYDKDGKNILKDENKLEAVINPQLKEDHALDSASWNDGARLFKYEIDKTATYKFCENDFVLLRYADILWMNEEAIKRGGTGTSHFASADFQQMLTRAFAYSENPLAEYKQAYGDPAGWSLEQICDERGREFSWENLRRRDLIRFGQFEKVQYVKNDDPKRRWFPIPYLILEKAERGENGEAIWTQNAGY